MFQLGNRFHRDKKTSIYVVLLIVCFAVAFALIYRTGSFGKNEPQLNGKVLSDYLNQYRTNVIHGENRQLVALRDEAAHAISQIGSNAIPHLLRMLCKSDSEIARALQKVYANIPFAKSKPPPAWVLNENAVYGFVILGKENTNAVLALTRICAENPSLDCRLRAIYAIGLIGPAAKPAIPILLRHVGSSNLVERRTAIGALGTINAEPEIVVPHLVESLGTTDVGVQVVAIRALGQYGSNAVAAVVQLSHLLESSDPRVRDFAKRALDSIHPRHNEKNLKK